MRNSIVGLCVDDTCVSCVGRLPLLHCDSLSQSPLFPCLCLLLPFKRRCLSPFPPRSLSLLNLHTAAAADEATGPLRPGGLEKFKTNNIYSSQILRAKTLVEKLAMLPLAAQPTKVDPAPSKLSRPFTGSPWRRPVFSRRQLAVLKKEATAAGLEWPMPEKEVRQPSHASEAIDRAC